MKQIQRKSKLGLPAIALFVLVMAWGVPGAYAGCSDFNGDGKDDLAIGVPGNRVGNVNRAGAVHVLYGRPDSLEGLGSGGDQLWTQRGLLIEGTYTQDIGGAPEEDDAFGEALATGDFNGDGFCDLAIGVPGEDLRVDGNNVRDAGVVIVLYGSRSGLFNRNHQLWTQRGILTSDGFTQDIAEKPDPDDQFGNILVAGNFNGDTRDGRPIDDLAVGIPLEDIPGVGEVPCRSRGGGFPLGGRTDLMCPAPDIVEAGAVQILLGSSNGLSNDGSQFWTQKGLWIERDGYTSNIQGAAEAYDFFGFSLAAGNFNRDMRDGRPIDDLAIGVPYETLGDGGRAKTYAGAVHILFGSRNGLTNTDNQLWTEDSGGMPDEAKSFNKFGWSLAAGNFDGQGGHDLAIGVAHKWIQSRTSGGTHLNSTGAIIVLYSSGHRLSAENSVYFTVSSTVGVEPFDELENNVSYGTVLVSGDFDGNGSDDLAVGDPQNWIASGDTTKVGAVHVLYGAAQGVSVRLAYQNSQLWTQNSEGITGVSQSNDRFGSALASADYNGDGRSDLAIGVPFESVISGNTDIVDAGMVNVIYGSANRLTSAGNQPWHQAIDGIYGEPTRDDHFGFALAGGRSPSR
jgi:hypothetical protein